MSGTFLDRWSRRKSGEHLAETPTGDEPPAPQSASAETTAETTAKTGADTGKDTGADTRAEATPLSDDALANLPRIEDLGPESDLRAFLRPGVPAALKNAAMRKMWLLTPAIRDHKDCAVDYAWDWNTPGGVPGSGGRLTAQSVQKMMNSLLDPQDVEKNTEMLGAEKPEAPAAHPVPATDPSPKQAPQAVSSEHAPHDPPAARPLHSAPPLPPRRRHGGAMPS